MKLFVSWSGEYSRKVAEVLKFWIPSVIQSVEVFYSPDDIGKGENWSNRLSKELEECNFGIICLTPENVSAPWIHFEAGSLAKSMDSRVSALMLGINTSDVKGPLSRFQNTRFEEKDFNKLIRSINETTESPLNTEILQYIFDIMWPHLKEKVEAIQKEMSEALSVTAQKDGEASVSESAENDALQEILHIVRKLDGSSPSTKHFISAPKTFIFDPMQPTFDEHLKTANFYHSPNPNPKEYIITITDVGPDPEAVTALLNDHYNDISRFHKPQGKKFPTLLVCTSLKKSRALARELNKIGAQTTISILEAGDY